MLRAAAIGLALIGAAGIGAPAVAGAASAKPAKCSIWRRGAIQYDGPCGFEAARGGSFSLSFPWDSGDIALRNIDRIHVRITAPGVAQVSDTGPDRRGNAWGRARRSTLQRACWASADFRVCAYS